MPSGITVAEHGDALAALSRATNAAKRMTQSGDAGRCKAGKDILDAINDFRKKPK